MTAETPPGTEIAARLQELIQETDYDFVLELIDIYLTESPKHLQAIEAAVKAQDHRALTVSAHTLKGSSLNLGAKQLGALSGALEELGRSGKPIPPDTRITEVEAEYERVQTILLTFKQSKQ